MSKRTKCKIVSFLAILGIAILGWVSVSQQKGGGLETPGGSLQKMNIENKYQFVKRTNDTAVLEMKDPKQSGPFRTSNINIAKIDGNADPFWQNQLNLELEKLPEKLLKTFEEEGWKICITDCDINKVFYDGKYELVLGTTNYAKKQIYIADNERAIQEATMHEIGHWLDYRNGFLTNTDAFGEIWDAEASAFIRAYQATCVRDRKELFAEGFYQYMLNSSQLQMKTPALYDFINERICAFL